MTQRGLGIALGGGGGRGPAHRGVLRALEEAGIAVHCGAGSSAGVIVAALYTLEGVSDAVIETLNRPADCRAFDRDRLRLQESNPIGARIAARGRAPPRAVAPRGCDRTADVWTREHVAPREGPRLPALQASIAIPFVAPPVLLNGRFLADTGREGFSALEAVRFLDAEVMLEALLYPTNQIETPEGVERLARPLVSCLGRDQAASGRPDGRTTWRFALDLTIRRKPRLQPADVLICPRTPLVPLLTPAGVRRGYDVAGCRAARAAPPRPRALLPGETAAA